MTAKQQNPYANIVVACSGDRRYGGEITFADNVLVTVLAGELKVVQAHRTQHCEAGTTVLLPRHQPATLLKYPKDGAAYQAIILTLPTALVRAYYTEHAPAPAQPATAQGTTATTATPAQGAPAAAPVAAPTTTIAQALPTLPQHATLNKLVAAAGLEATLAGPGPFTVLAPTDEAFSRMPAGALDTLLAPANKPSLTKILQYHVIPGKLTADQIKAQITAGGGSTKLTTANGEQLTASLGENGNIMLTDVNNVKSYVSQADLQQTNGIVHITNGVVFPKLG